MSTAANPSTSSVPTPRSPQLNLGQAIPRHWFGGNVLATHLVNGVSMLFPAGERFFVRSVFHYMDQIDDPLLRAQIKGFFGQEGRHAKEHDRWNEILSEQGYSVETFLSIYERIAYGVVERLASPSLRLAATAACEHFTAMLAERVLRFDVLSHADPTMAQLLKWHAAEEIEHRSVAFDVMQKVSPSYAMRVAGLAVAATLLGGFWCTATLMLLWQDRKRLNGSLQNDAKQLREVRKRNHVKGVFLPGIREYLQKDFHPAKLPLDELAKDYLLTAQLS